MKKNFEIIEEGRIRNTETQEEFIDLFGDGVTTNEEGEEVINFQNFSNVDGIDYYTPQGREELSKVERMFGTDGTGTVAQSWHVYDPSEVEDDVLRYVDEDGTEKEWNFSALQRRKARKIMMKEIAKADGTKNQRAVATKWMNYCNNNRDTGAAEMIKLYRDSEEMTLMYLYMTLGPRGKLYEVYK